MEKILHDPKDPKLWELWYIPYYGSCRILSINRSTLILDDPLCGPDPTITSHGSNQRYYILGLGKTIYPKP